MGFAFVCCLHHPCGRAEQRSLAGWLRKDACLSQQASLRPSPAGRAAQAAWSASARSRTPGSPFFCLSFFGEAKKRRSAAGPRPGLHAEHFCDAKKPCPSPLATQRCSVKQQVFTVTLEILRTAATRWLLLNASFKCQHVSQLFLKFRRRAAH